MSPMLITALMALGTVFSLSGLVVLRMHRKQRRLQVQAIQDAPAAQYTYNPATNLYSLDRKSVV